MSTKRTREEETKHRTYLRKRFKKLIRLVSINLQWLEDKNDTGGISMNVKRNVAMLVRQKQKVGMVTLANKTLLSTRAETRTIAERKELCLLIAGLPCFQYIPPKIRARLVPHLIFMHVNPKQVFIREGDIPLNIYFVLSGQIEMKLEKYNKVTGQLEIISQAIFGAGDCIGDIEVVENYRRLSTYVALTECEVLFLCEPDYRKLLLPFLNVVWNQKKTAIKSLEYFKFLNETQFLHACKFCTLVKFEPLDTIYHDDKGALGSVHFILSGECIVLQCLSMVASYNKGKRVLNLVEVKKDDTTFVHQSKKSQSFLNQYDVNKLILSSSQEDKQDNRRTLENVENQCAQFMKNFANFKKAEHKKIHKHFKNRVCVNEEEYFLDCYDEEFSDESEESVEFETVFSEAMPKSKSSYILSKHNISEEVSKTVSLSSTFSSSSCSVEPTTTVPAGARPRLSKKKLPNNEIHFINVGSLTFGAVFGLGEEMEHRSIMAKTVVQCLLLPRFWLFDKAQNPGNIWQRRKFLFENNVPSRTKIFENFLRTRKWDSFRHSYVQSCLDKTVLKQSAKKEDIPIMCSIVETNDEAGGM